MNVDEIPAIASIMPLKRECAYTTGGAPMFNALVPGLCVPFILCESDGSGFSLGICRNSFVIAGGCRLQYSASDGGPSFFKRQEYLVGD